jgi:hypothetical protein
MDGLRRISDILKDMTDEFRKSNDEWERRYGSTNVSRSSNDGATNEGSKQIHKGDKQDGSL